MKTSPWFDRILFLAVFCPLALFGYSSGPDATTAGVPGETTCASCHGGGSGSGSVKVIFAGGNTYAPGVKQHFTVTIADSAQKRWGFELTARLSNNTTQAGSFTPGADGYTQLVCADTKLQNESWGRTCPSTQPLQYIEHTTSGSRNGVRNSVNFDFDWTPPATDMGTINIYVAANAANGDGGTGGDHIYTAHYTLTSAPTVPTPAITSVVNAGGFQNFIEAGSFVAITGTNLANSTRSWGAADLASGKLPTSLDGVSVTINGKSAYINYISPGQINLIAPADSSLGSVAVVVNNNGVMSKTGTVMLSAQSPAAFLWAGQYAVATHLDYSLVGPTSLYPGATTPAKPGETIIVWGTGLGATTPAAPDGIFTPTTSLYSVTNPVTARVGDIPANVAAAVLTPTAAGLYQVVVQIPSSAPDGDLPIYLIENGIQSPDGVLITVQH